MPRELRLKEKEESRAVVVGADVHFWARKKKKKRKQKVEMKKLIIKLKNIALYCCKSQLS